MNRLMILSLFSLFFVKSFSQSLVKIGERPPNYNFEKILNSTSTSLKITDLQGKPTVLLFWGTWCAPCIPEMIKMGELKKKFGEKIQMIAVSNDDVRKLNTFILKRPTKIWFASDPSNNLWRIFDLQTAGFAVLLDAKTNVVDITETKNIDSTVIAGLIDSKSVNLVEQRGEKRGDFEMAFGTDSTVICSFLIKPVLPGIMPMSRRPNKGTFANRRIEFINLSPLLMYMEAFSISSHNRVFYSTVDDSLKANQTKYCVDFIADSSNENYLRKHFGAVLNQNLTIKGEKIRRIIPCLVLKNISGRTINISESKTTIDESGFNGLEYDGEGVLIKSFTDYLENELNVPIYDATGLNKHYDIHFSRNNIDPIESSNKSLSKMGLELVEGQKELDVIFISSNPKYSTQ